MQNVENVERYSQILLRERDSDRALSRRKDEKMKIRSWRDSTCGFHFDSDSTQQKKLLA
jgi:hypothetical protein